MKKYSLAVQPSSYYFDQFKEEAIVIMPYREGGRYQLVEGEFVKATPHTSGSTIIHLQESPEQGHLNIKAGELDFDIYFLDLINAQVAPESIDSAKDVLRCVVELDAVARSVPSSEDYEEQLAYINISKAEVELHYFSNTVNTEWGAYFVKDASGAWEFKGLG